MFLAGIQRLSIDQRRWMPALLRPSMGFALRASLSAVQIRSSRICRAALREFKIAPDDFVAGMTKIFRTAERYCGDAVKYFLKLPAPGFSLYPLFTPRVGDP